MNNFTDQIKSILLEEFEILNKKIKGVNFLEIYKYNLLAKLMPIIKQNKENKKLLANQNFIFEKEDKTLSVNFIYLESRLSLLKKLIEKNTLFISLYGQLKIDIFQNNNEKRFHSFNIYPNQGICLPKDTAINLNSQKTNVYISINLDEKFKDIEN